MRGGPSRGIVGEGPRADGAARVLDGVSFAVERGQVVTGEHAAEPFDGGFDLKGARLAFAPRQFLDLVDRVYAILAGQKPTPILSGTNTTLGVLATDATLTKAQAHRLAQAGHDGLARARLTCSAVRQGRGSMRSRMDLVSATAGTGTNSSTTPQSPGKQWNVAVIVGTLLGVVFGASSLYLVLKVGLTVSASIPVAVISITFFRLLSKFGFRDATILENNIVQTAGSAGESGTAGGRMVYVFGSSNGTRSDLFSSRISSSLKGWPSAVPWTSTKRPRPVFTMFMSTWAEESSS